MRTGMRHLLPKRNRRSTASDLSRQLSSATGRTVYRPANRVQSLGYIGLYARRPQMCSTYCNSLSPVINLEQKACFVDTTTVVLCDVFRRVQV
ncbi:hypothetical protein TNCV_5033091 [Trichonephila clavipes]|nr:hypothetical protein TNCV_5033091 [Trichonephila clavipes]